jgi:hypothetical protein
MCAGISVTLVARRSALVKRSRRTPDCCHKKAKIHLKKGSDLLKSMAQMEPSAMNIEPCNGQVLSFLSGESKLFLPSESVRFKVIRDFSGWPG